MIAQSLADLIIALLPIIAVVGVALVVAIIIVWAMSVVKGNEGD